MPDSAPAGFYHAEGDPPDTVRYWDGTTWMAEPEPLSDHPELSATGSYAAEEAGFAGAGLMRTDTTRYGTLGIRMGAQLIDIVIGSIVIILTMPFTAGSLVAAGIVTLIWWLIIVGMVARLGGSPGKLAVGLRVTRIDGNTTPPGDQESAMRALPGLLGLIPWLGPLIALAIAVVSIYLVSNDPERRSVYDRIGGTRVVYKNRLS
ncbi:MAG: RDD family protein [Dehalococcoidia bacterium]